MRPTYETDDDLTAEADVAVKIVNAWSCNMHKLPRSYHVDFMASKDGRALGWIEVKCRRNESGAYQTLHISLAKILNGLRLEREVGGTRFLLVVSWTDFIGWLQPSKVPYSVTMGGRNDRNDPEDVEPVAVFDTSLFKSLSAGK